MVPTCASVCKFGGSTAPKREGLAQVLSKCALKVQIEDFVRNVSPSSYSTLSLRQMPLRKSEARPAWEQVGWVGVGAAPPRMKPAYTKPTASHVTQVVTLPITHQPHPPYKPRFLIAPFYSRNPPGHLGHSVLDNEKKSK